MVIVELRYHWNVNSMSGKEEYDIFFSHSSLDHPQVKPILKFLQSKGLKVWFDDKEILDYEEITKSIESGLAKSKVLLAYYSHNYPQSRPCQYELTSALIAAHQLGNHPSRVLVINPETSYDHIHPVELRDQSQPNRYLVSGELDQLAKIITDHVRKTRKVFGEIVNRQQVRWYGKTGIGSRRFVGRMSEMWKIHSALHASSFYFISKSHVPAIAQLVGMGGIGKSLFAEEYALWFAAAFPGGIFWLNAFGNDDIGSVMTPEEREAERIRQLLDIAVRYGIVTESKKPDEITAEFYTQIVQRNLPFLWIVDDIPAGMIREDLEKWLSPNGSQGRTLITTRTSSYSFLGTSIVLDPLEPEESMELLYKWRKPDSPDEEDAAKKIATTLGDHPLALEVVGALLEQSISGSPFIDLERSLADRTRDALEVGKELAGILPTDHEVSIAKTFLMSIDYVGDEGKDLLRLASVLATEPIFGSLVSKVFADVDSLAEKTAKQRAENAFFLVTQQSLAKRVGNIPAKLLVHPLISRTIRLTDAMPDRTKQLRDAAIKVHTKALYKIRDGQIHRELAPILPHARELIATAEDLQCADLVASVAKFDLLQGSFGSAEKLYRKELEIRIKFQGNEHPATLVSIDNLAHSLSAQGNYAEAQVLQEYVLNVLRKHLDKDHPDSLMSMNNLGLTLLEKGDLVGARGLQEQVLKVNRELVGEEHPNTLTSMSNLAGTLAIQGDFAEARTLQEHVLNVREKNLGRDHPSTLIAMDNLAGTLRSVGDLSGAHILQEQVVDRSKEMFGMEHPDTLTSMNNLAETLRVMGKLTDARNLQEHVLKISKKHFGEKHPNTLSSMNNLAMILHEQGDLIEARNLDEQVMKCEMENLGEGHIKTLTSMNNLGETLRDLGDLTGARELHERVREVSTKTFGEKHPNSLISMNNLAITLHQQGNLKEARELQEQALKMSTETLGENHINTLASMFNLAEILRDQGDLFGARKLQENALKISQEILGKQHPKTILLMESLARTLHSQGHLLGSHKLRKRIKQFTKKT